jgi:hypothetical protein
MDIVAPEEIVHVGQILKLLDDSRQGGSVMVSLGIPHPNLDSRLIKEVDEDLERQFVVVDDPFIEDSCFMALEHIDRDVHGETPGVSVIVTLLLYRTGK